MSTWDKFTSFISSHRAAVLIGSATVVASTAGVYYYYSTVNPTSKPVKKSKKKSEKKPKKTEETPSSKDIAGFPLVKEPTTDVEYPEIPAGANLKSLSDEDKEAIATQFKLVGNSFFGKKKYQEALDFYQKAINVSNDPIFYSNRAACYSALEQYDKVIDETTAALKMKPDYLKCILRRAVAYEKLGKLEDALLDTTSALILRNFTDATLNANVDKLINERAKEIVDELLENRPPKFPSSAFCSTFLSSIIDISVLPEFLENAEPESSEYDIKLAVVALRNETDASYEQALELFNKAIEKGGDHTYYALALRSVLKFLCCDYEAAQEDTRLSISLKGTVLPYLVNASIELEQSNLTGATIEMSQAEAVDPESPFVAFHKGQFHFLLGQLKDGLDLFDKAAKIDPNLVMARVQGAVSEYRMGNSKEAHARFTVLRNEFPNSPIVRLYEGEIYMDEGDLQEAAKRFDEAADLSKSRPGDMNVHPLVNKALLLIQQGERDESLELLRKAVTLDPKSDLALSTLAQLYMQLQESDKAAEIFDRAIKIARSPAEISNFVQLKIATHIQTRIQKERPIIAQKMAMAQEASRAAAYAKEISGAR